MRFFFTAILTIYTRKITELCSFKTKDHYHPHEVVHFVLHYLHFLRLIHSLLNRHEFYPLASSPPKKKKVCKLTFV